MSQDNAHVPSHQTVRLSQGKHSGPEHGVPRLKAVSRWGPEAAGSLAARTALTSASPLAEAELVG